MKRITITCEDCGRRHRLERPVGAPGTIWIICHECELPLHALLETVEDLPAAAAPSTAFEAAWAGMLDLSPSSGR